VRTVVNTSMVMARRGGPGGGDERGVCAGGEVLGGATDCAGAAGGGGDCGDTGPLHLAAALDRPVVGIYGPTDPARNGPYGDGAERVLRDAESSTSHKRVTGAGGGDAADWGG
jgi:hypothetical protein